ncbi:MAG: hypothetical protein JWO08_4357 [Verrucomicrobiaceae bacterium]|nr:hypothetical protein [Verrucomicrobiaceae bacterium]
MAHHFFAAHLSKEALDLMRSLKPENPALGGLAEAFTDNTLRVQTMSSMVQELCKQTLSTSMSFIHIIGMAGSPEKMMEIFAMPGKAKEFAEKLVEISGQLPAESITAMTEMAFALAPSIRYGVNGVLDSMVVSAWTAFEVMAGDLWETALNDHPKYLASLSSDGLKELKLSYLERNDYDLRKKMGSIHRDVGTYKFQILTGEKGIQRAYKDAFHKDGDRVRAAISNKAFEALAVIRNILVHKQGKADRKFLKECKGLPGMEKWAALNEGDKIQLQGEDVGSLVSASFIGGCALISAVDEWLTAHPSS